MHSRRLAAFVIPALFVGTLAGVSRTTVLAQTPGKTVWDGVYTDAQAARGQQAFVARGCPTCHGQDLQGQVNGNMGGRALIGDRFMSDFNQDTVGRLFTTIRDRMPRNAPGTSPEDALNLAAFVLKGNGFPAGSADLPTELPQLRAIRIAPKNPGPIANFALIKTVGCLARTGDTWSLSNASDPVITSDSLPSKDEDLIAANGRELGTGSFQLLTTIVTPSGGDTGHKVEAKGLLIRNPNGNRLNLQSVQSIGSSCQP